MFGYILHVLLRANKTKLKKNQKQPGRVTKHFLYLLGFFRIYLEPPELTKCFAVQNFIECVHLCVQIEAFSSHATTQ